MHVFKTQEYLRSLEGRVREMKRKAMIKEMRNRAEHEQKAREMSELDVRCKELESRFNALASENKSSENQMMQHIFQLLSEKEDLV